MLYSSLHSKITFHVCACCACSPTYVSLYVWKYYKTTDHIFFPFSNLPYLLTIYLLQSILASNYAEMNHLEEVTQKYIIINVRITNICLLFKSSELINKCLLKDPETDIT